MAVTWFRIEFGDEVFEYPNPGGDFDACVRSHERLAYPVADGVVTVDPEDVESVQAYVLLGLHPGRVPTAQYEQVDGAPARRSGPSPAHRLR